ncbi:tenascin X [Tieghemostelium lacteum]|uniref:Tenascin X n=1 Tax=Tieghemostelium lacteum TaxID=361077 RepID=A0A151ZC58_TIELA|nr:tenascin X [Tieghemostelium lacteum]|eukprot:KYQ91519.1 tenascin X [Tieghemostelium lacteum]
MLCVENVNGGSSGDNVKKPKIKTITSGYEDSGIYDRAMPDSEYIFIDQVQQIDYQNGFIFEGFLSITAGESGSGHGDFNGDGILDMLFVDSFQQKGYLVFGPIFQQDNQTFSMDIQVLMDGTRGMTFANLNASLFYPGYVPLVLDINNDGYDDIVFYGNYLDDSGIIGLWYGHAPPFNTTFDLSNFNGQNGFQVIGNSGQLLGYSMAVADINVDGNRDLILLAPYNNSVTSAIVYVIYGRNQSKFSTNLQGQLNLTEIIDGVQGFKIESQPLFQKLNYLQTCDVNTDGVDDVVLFSNRAIYVIFGNKTYTEYPPTFTPTESNFNGQNGFIIKAFIAGVDNMVLGSVGYNQAFNKVSCGDFNGDSLNDLVVTYKLLDDVYRISIIYGIDITVNSYPQMVDVVKLNAVNGFTIEPPSSNPWAFNVLLKDINNDGLADLQFTQSFPVQDSFQVIFGTFYQPDPKIYIFQQGVFDSVLILSNIPILQNQCKSLRILNISQSIISSTDVNGDHINDMIIQSLTNYYVVYGHDTWNRSLIEMNTEITYNNPGESIYLFTNINLPNTGCQMTGLRLTVLDTYEGDLIDVQSMYGIHYRYLKGEQTDLIISGESNHTIFEQFLETIIFSPSILRPMSTNCTILLNIQGYKTQFTIYYKHPGTTTSTPPTNTPTFTPTPSSSPRNNINDNSGISNSFHSIQTLYLNLLFFLQFLVILLINNI